MSLNSKDIIKKYELEIGKVEVYKNYMIAYLNEGIILSLERAYELNGISEIHFGNRDFAYIAVRNHSYSVDPFIYTHTKKIKNLKAFAVVSKMELLKHSFKIEQHFFGDKPMKMFNNIEEALQWVKSILNK
ncbi:STAS/SEC14 domain-containing protein [Ascidiimonas aurantiaca]|uniref:STAS/SEC14 domain-containing protein n=1 Tax=Ascidiimonas aurantiaca TaxID=1685432 RepID=UPI0030ECCDAE